MKIDLTAKPSFPSDKDCKFHIIEGKDGSRFLAPLGAIATGDQLYRIVTWGKPVIFNMGDYGETFSVVQCNPDEFAQFTGVTGLNVTYCFAIFETCTLSDDGKTMEIDNPYELGFNVVGRTEDVVCKARQLAQGLGKRMKYVYVVNGTSVQSFVNPPRGTHGNP